MSPLHSVPPAVDPDPFGDAQPAGLLDDYRVDLRALIRDGIPTPEYVPGLDGFVRAGKRYLVPAPAGTGKSLAWLRLTVGVVHAGGEVVILDVENGSDEYARRLDDILGATGGLTDEQWRRLRYHAWPQVRTDWDRGEWVAAIGNADLVIFDSSRMMLSQSGLDENSANEYAAFVDAILMPLSHAGIATIMLDNTGHENSRARGSKSKEDLNEVVYELSARGTIDENSTGALTFKLTRARFAGLHRQLEMQVGGGVYEMPSPVEQSYDESGNWRPTIIMGRVAEHLGQNPGANARSLKEAGLGDTRTVPLALRQLVKEGFVRAEPGPRGEHKHYLEKPFLN